MLSNMGWKQSYSGLCTGLLLLLLCNLSEQTAQQSQIRIDPDGGYTGIVIKINKDVPQDLCPKILSNIKVSKKIPSGTFTKATKMKVAKGGFKSEYRSKMLEDFYFSKFFFQTSIMTRKFE